MKLCAVTSAFFGLFAAAGLALAQEASTAASDSRYGLFNGLDHRSSYGRFLFPEPFLVDALASERDPALRPAMRRGGAGSKVGLAGGFDFARVRRPRTAGGFRPF